MSFFGDTGGLRGSKRECDEGGYRMPYVILGPGVQARHSLFLTFTPDWRPTIADLAGESIPSGVRGKSLKPVLFSDEDPQRSPKRPLIFPYRRIKDEEGWIVRRSNWRMWILKSTYEAVADGILSIRDAYASGNVEVRYLHTDPGSPDNVLDDPLIGDDLGKAGVRHGDKWDPADKLRWEETWENHFYSADEYYATIAGFVQTLRSGLSPSTYDREN